MKRLGVGFVITIAVLFAVVSISKLRPAEDGAQPVRGESSAADRAKVLRFWELYRQATDYRIAGRTGQAAETYAQALELNEEHEDALYYHGNMLFQLGQLRGAESTWSRLVEVNPSSARAHSRLGAVYSCVDQPQLLDLERAEAEYLLALEINKEETGPLLSLGEVALLRGDLRMADVYFDKVIGSNYTSVDAHFLKGYIAWKNGDPETASQLFAAAVRYARPVDAVGGVAGEGDTQTGSAPMVTTSDICRGLRAHTDELAAIADVDVAREAAARYRRLERTLADARTSPGSPQRD